MKETGQVFTADMVFALLLVVAFVSVSGQAYDIAAGRTRSYSNRYSLERQANDITDVLVRSSGTPIDWENHINDLETLGFAENRNGEPVPNRIDFRKLSSLAAAIRGDNWNPSEETDDRAIERFFGTDKFEITVKMGDFSLSFWPGKEPEEKSPRTESLEVASVERLVYGPFADIRALMENVRFDPQGPPVPPFLGDNEFWVGPGEIEAYDWYMYAENLGTDPPDSKVKVTFNRYMPPTNEDIWFEPEYPKRKPIDSYLEEGQMNFFDLHGGEAQRDNLDFYVVALTENQNPENMSRLIEPEPFTLQVRLWR